AANVEKAEIGNRASTFGGDATGALERVHTPNLPGIEDVGKFMKVKPKNMIKTLVFQASGAEGISYVVAVVRGDHDVNEAKLGKAAAAKFGVAGIALVDSPEVRKEWAIG